MHLIVRSKNKEQEAARKCDDKFGFHTVHGDACIDGLIADVSEVYLWTTLGMMRAVPVLDCADAEIVCRDSFRRSGFAFERTAAKAMHCHHARVGEDGTPVSELVPKEEAMMPIVLLAFV